MSTQTHPFQVLILPIGPDGVPMTTPWHENLARKLATLGITADGLHVALSAILRHDNVAIADEMGWTKAEAIAHANTSSEEFRRFGMPGQLLLLTELMSRNMEHLNILLNAVLDGETEKCLRMMKVQE